MSEPAVALVAGHGEFAQGLVSAVEHITGRDDVLVAMTNRGLGGADIERVMRELVESRGARVIFTDLPAGSCAIAARRLLASRHDLVVVTGVNLPALLDYVTHGEIPPHEAAQHAAERARSGVTVVGQPSGH
jgi:PTS system N-acetylgalactosamine-specific IIA component